jgi:transposase
MRSAVKNRVHALLAHQGILPEHSDLFGKSGREFVASVELPDGSRGRLDSLLSLTCDFDREITTTTREIDARAKADKRVSVLCQIRGVGRYTAMLITAEVGDVSRFPTARHLCAWAGLAPSVRSSDGKARLGHISHQGSPALRWALTEAAQKIPTGGGPLRAMLERIAKRPRAQDRQGRNRPPDSHPLLLRAPRRRDPLPQTPARHRRPRRRAAEAA